MGRQTSLLLRILIVPALVVVGLVVVFNLDGGFFTRLGGIVAAFVLVADLATFARGRMQNLLVMLAAILFGLGVIEAVAQTLTPHQLFEHGKGLFGDRAELGWGPIRPGTYPVERSAGGKVIYKATYTIDPDLLRHVASTAAGPTVAFFGDSFTFGDGVNDDGTLPQHFADLAPGLQVLNLAFSGYSPSQMLRELQVGLFDKELKDARLFLIQTGPLHVERVACKPNFSLRAPRYVTKNGKLNYKGPCTSGLWRRLREFLAETAVERVFISPVTRRPTHADVVDYINIMDAIAKLCREKYNVPFVVIYIPASPHQLDGTGFTDEEIRDKLRAAGIHLVTNEVEEKPREVLRIPDDGHFTSLGNHLIAQKVYDDLKKTMPDVLGTSKEDAANKKAPLPKRDAPH